jgi:hypothetical protein
LINTVENLRTAIDKIKRAHGNPNKKPRRRRQRGVNLFQCGSCMSSATVTSSNLS